MSKIQKNTEYAEQHSIFDDTPIAFAVLEMITDQNGKTSDFYFRYLNQACADLFKLSVNECTDSSFNAIFKNTDSVWLEYFAQTAQTGKRNCVRGLCPAASKYMEVKCYQIKPGVCGCCFTDLSEEKRLLENLEIEHKSFKAAITNSGLHFWEYDVQKNIAYQCELCQSDLSIPAVMEDYPNSWLATNIVMPQYWAQTIAMHKQLKQGVKTVGFVHEIWPPKSKQPRWEKVLYTNIFDEKGRPLKAIGVGIDITEEKRLEAEYNDFVQYQNMMSQSTNDAFKFNITRDSIAAVKDGMSLLSDKKHKMTMTEFFQKSKHRIHDKKDKKNYEAIYSRDNMLRLFENGTRNAEFSVKYENEQMETRNLLFRLTMAKQPTTGDILGLSYTSDITEEKLEQETLRSVVSNNFAYLFRVDGRSGKFVMFSHDNDAQLSVSEKGDDINDELAKIQAGYSVDGTPAPGEKLSRSVILKKLKKDRNFSITLSSTKDDLSAKKEIKCCRIDNEDQLFCITIRNL